MTAASDSNSESEEVLDRVIFNPMCFRLRQFDNFVSFIIRLIVRCDKSNLLVKEVGVWVLGRGMGRLLLFNNQLLLHASSIVPPVWRNYVMTLGVSALGE